MISKEMLYGIGGFMLGAIFTGVLTKLGELLFSKGKDIISPPDVEVDKRFEPPQIEGVSYAWVPELRVDEKLAESYQHYKHPTKKGNVYRLAILYGSHTQVEYLMSKPK